MVSCFAFFWGVDLLIENLYRKKVEGVRLGAGFPQQTIGVFSKMFLNGQPLLGKNNPIWWIYNTY